MLRLDPTDPRKTKAVTDAGDPAEITHYYPGEEFWSLGGRYFRDGQWKHTSWHEDGEWDRSKTRHPLSLSNAPEPPVTVERWVMLYRDGTGYYVTLSKRAPDQIPDADRIAAKKIEIAFTPGKFDL